MKNTRSLLAAACLLYACQPLAHAQEYTDLKDMSLEDLLVSDVSSVAKKRQKVADAPAAVYVISQEDIRRSGETTVPGLLRLAPGLEVGELDGNTTAITIRGFNSRFSNKLLVLVDGRAIYNTSLSGVFWDQIPTAVEDIERIEIIRGPGAAIWGANAVNGVINVITKHSADTMGTTVTAHAASNGRAVLLGRQGMTLGATGALRLYVKGDADPGPEDESGQSVNDGRENLAVGFRYDVEPTDIDAFTVQGDAQAGDFETTLTTGYPSVTRTTGESFSNFNLLGRWVRRESETSQSTVQAYVESSQISDFGIDLTRSSLDLDYSQTARIWGNHDLVWGLGYRYNSDDLFGQADITFNPRRRRDSIISGFIQDEIGLFDNRLALTGGVKVEHNDYTGYETQPSVRAIWKDPAGWAAWAAVSRAARTPSRFERDGSVGFQYFGPFDAQNPSPFPLRVVVDGSQDLKSEILTATEAGWRQQFGRNASIDLTVFHNRYKDALSFVPSETRVIGFPMPTLIEQHVVQTNIADLESVGAEATFKATLSPAWRMELGASTLDLNAEVNGASTNYQSVSGTGLSPSWQASFRSYLDITDTIDLDISFKHVAALRDSMPTPAYDDLDVRLGWRPLGNVELYLKGNNLLDDSRAEFLWERYPAPRSYIERSVQAGVAVRF